MAPLFRVLAGLSILLSPASVFAQNGAAVTGGDSLLSFSATRVEEAPDPSSWRQSPLWGQAEVLQDFIQMEPSEGVRGSEDTEVRLLYDDRAIYVGVWMYDSEPERIIVGERRRDASLGRADAFLVVFDTYRDLQNGFVFGTTPGGIQYDGQVVSEGRGGGGGGRQQGGSGGGFNINWDGNWSVVTETDDRGWYALFRIPFSTLRYGSAERQTWGINFARYVGRKNEQAFWSPIPRQYNFYRLSNAGVVQDLEVPARRVFTVTPYALSAAQRIPAVNDRTEYPFEVGGDAKVGVTQGLTLDLTLNTDFAQVEVDEQQIDLTRFSLLFPEKRPFFLENSGRFAVGSTTATQMFFSRRIGLSASGAPVGIDWGSRLSGRVAGLNVGLLHMRTEAVDGLQPANSYSVARIARELPNRSQVGFIVTDRSAVGTSGNWGRTYAVDANLGIGEYMNFATVLGKVDTPDERDHQSTINLTGEYRNRDWNVTAFYDRVGANFNPEVGYTRRRDFRHVGGTFWRYLRFPGVEWLREMRPHVGYDRSHDLDGFKETEVYHIHNMVIWESGAQIGAYVDWTYDGLSRAQSIGGILVQPGIFEGRQYQVRANTSTQQPLVLRTGADWGDFLSGTQRSGFVRADFQIGGTFAGQVQYQMNRVEFVEGSTRPNLATGRLAYSFTPNLYVQGLVQHNSQSKTWSGNLRLGWIDSAGSGLFLVYNERHADAFDEPLERSFVVKYSRQIDVTNLGFGGLW